MIIQKKIYLFTYGYPQGKSEYTFLNYEISRLVDDFKDVEIIPQKKINEKISIKRRKNLIINYELANEITLFKILYFFFTFTIFSFDFYKELKKIWLTKNFFYKLKFLITELTKSQICYNWIKLNKLINNNQIIFYSFWSNFTLLTFEKLKKEYPNLITISRTLGSDLNGFIKNDDYVPYIKKKFYSLDKVFVLGNFQKKLLLKKNLIQKKKIIICPLGVFKQTNYQNYLKKTKILFLSCNNFIKIKNTLMIINFLKKFAKKTDKKIIYYIIGKGEEKKAIISSLNKSKNLFKFKLINRVENLIGFIRQKKINFFMNFSSQEGMSFSIMEAMSCGVPVISSNIIANNNLIKKNSGYLIDIENFNISSKSIIKKIINDIKFKKNFYKKSKNSKKIIDKNLINYRCYEKFKKEIKSI